MQLITIMISFCRAAWSSIRLQRIKMTSAPPQQAVVFIIGTTGTGKSDLAVHLARRFDGEIINADAMQIYCGLPIVTNKLPLSERADIPHHLFDSVDPLEFEYRVPEFRRDAVEAVRQIHARNKLPIIAGGSLYYVESLLWEILISADDVEPSTHAMPALLPFSSDSNQSAALILSSNTLEGISSAEMHKILAQIDPEQANVLHPNDKRKIIRSLEIYVQHGRRHSELLKEQQRDVLGGSSISGPLLQREALILLLQCVDEEELNTRLDSRVDQMIQRGLIDELREFHEQYNQRRLSMTEKPDYERGIFQSIGFKEFHDYLTSPPPPIDADEKSDKLRQKTWNFAVDQMKRRTRKYARTQLQWINNRMIQRAGDRELPCTYKLDVSDKSAWNDTILPRAEQIVSDYLLGHTPENVAERVVQTQPKQTHLDQRNYNCDACQVTCRGKVQFDVHMQSKRHRYVKRKEGRLKKSAVKAGTKTYANDEIERKIPSSKKLPVLLPQNADENVELKIQVENLG